jgi:ribonuclease P/MRP protein subunit POP5
MVRLKNRYLLLDILYPDSSTWPSTKTVSAGPHAAQLAIHAPTSDALTPGLLAKMIREEVGEMYGDWGVGKLGGASATGVQGINHSDLFALSSSFDGLRTDYL